MTNPIPAKHDYGPLQQYEITWTNGHREIIEAHQVIEASPNLMDTYMGRTADRSRMITIHGEIDGKWRLILRAPADDIRIIRNVTAGERIAE